MHRTEAGGDHLGRSPAVARGDRSQRWNEAVAELKPCPPRWHNVTPEEDYRTALLSDSPDAGCSLSLAVGEMRNDPDAQSGLPVLRRPSATRSRSFRPPITARQASSHGCDRGTPSFRTGVPRHEPNRKPPGFNRPPGRTDHVSGREANKQTRKKTYQVGAEILVRMVVGTFDLPALSLATS
jgi:hypothetical protein